MERPDATCCRHRLPETRNAAGVELSQGAGRDAWTAPQTEAVIIIRAGAERNDARGTEGPNAFVGQEHLQLEKARDFSILRVVR